MEDGRVDLGGGEGVGGREDLELEGGVSVVLEEGVEGGV